MRLEVRQNGETKRVERWRWRDDGNLASHVLREPDSGSVESTRYRYVCGAAGVE